MPQETMSASRDNLRWHCSEHVRHVTHDCCWACDWSSPSCHMSQGWTKMERLRQSFPSLLCGFRLAEVCRRHTSVQHGHRQINQQLVAHRLCSHFLERGESVVRSNQWAVQTDQSTGSGLFVRLRQCWTLTTLLELFKDYQGNS